MNKNVNRKLKDPEWVRMNIIDPYMKKFVKLEKNEKHEEIIELINSMLEKEVNNHELDEILIIDKAKIYFRLKNFKESIKNYEFYFSKYPENKKIKYLEGLVISYYFIRNYKKAKEISIEILGKEKNNVIALEILLDIYFYTNQFQEGLRHIENEVTSKVINSNKGILYKYAKLKAGNREYKIAIDLFKETIDLPIIGKYSYDEMAECYYELGDLENALKCLKIMQRKDKKYRDVYYKLSVIYKELGDEKRAKKYMDKYNKIPDDE